MTLQYQNCVLLYHTLTMLYVTRNSTKRSSTIRYLHTIWHYLTSPHQYSIPLNLTQQYLHRIIHVWTTPVQICTAPDFAGPIPTSTRPNFASPIRDSTVPHRTVPNWTSTPRHTTMLHRYTATLHHTAPLLYTLFPIIMIDPESTGFWSSRLNTAALDCTVTLLCHAEPCCTVALRRFTRPLLNSQPIHRVSY